MPPNESTSDLEQRLASVVLAEVMKQRTAEPATTRFVRGTLDEGDTLPFALEEPTQPSAPYELVAVEMDVDLGTAPAPKYPPATELQLSASKNLVMDTMQVAKLERQELAPKKQAAPTKKVTPVKAAPKQVAPVKVAPVKAAPLAQVAPVAAPAPRKTRRVRATTAVMRTTQAKTRPSVLAMIMAFVLGATAFLLGLGLARLMM